MNNTAFEPCRILYQDADLIAVNKLAGELVVADRWGKEPHVLLHALGDYLRSIGHGKDASGRDLYPVHRLDRDTSGVVLFAKHRAAHKLLSGMFEGREVEKTYWAFTSGCPPWEQHEVDAPLSRREGKRGRGRGFVDLVNGKPAQTAFRVLQCFGDIAWLEAKPLTGRLHQIRLHAQLAGFPLLNDPHYGKADWKSGLIGVSPLARFPLHARTIEFNHPTTGAPVRIEAPLDAALATFMHELAAASGTTLPNFPL